MNQEILTDEGDIPLKYWLVQLCSMGGARKLTFPSRILAARCRACPTEKKCQHDTVFKMDANDTASKLEQ